MITCVSKAPVRSDGAWMPGGGGAGRSCGAVPLRSHGGVPARRGRRNLSKKGLPDFSNQTASAFALNMRDDEPKSKKIFHIAE